MNAMGAGFTISDRLVYCLPAFNIAIYFNGVACKVIAYLFRKAGFVLINGVY